MELCLQFSESDIENWDDFMPARLISKDTLPESVSA